MHLHAKVTTIFLLVLLIDLCWYVLRVEFELWLKFVCETIVLLDGSMYLRNHIPLLVLIVRRCRRAEPEKFVSARPLRTYL